GIVGRGFGTFGNGFRAIGDSVGAFRSNSLGVVGRGFGPVSDSVGAFRSNSLGAIDRSFGAISNGFGTVSDSIGAFSGNGLCGGLNLCSLVPSLLLAGAGSRRLTRDKEDKRGSDHYPN
ncbi:MAG: hypothetical protein KDD78_04930, partial [Caldilineaceae bacterium]|nr:hypothetical protein [Caldilineaceae bacterium]